MLDLTVEQEEVMMFSCLGLSTAEIAQALNMDITEVQKHLSDVMLRLQAKSKLEACVLYLRDGGDR